MFHYFGIMTSFVLDSCPDLLDHRVVLCLALGYVCGGCMSCMFMLGVSIFSVCSHIGQRKISAILFCCSLSYSLDIQSPTASNP